MSRRNTHKQFACSRRAFLAAASAAVCASAAPAFSSTNAFNQSQPSDSFKGSYCFFSKQLPNMNPAQLARSVKAIGFGGVDLTVRPGGHVLPDSASVDLPRAVAAIRAEEVEVPMITTALLSASDPTARPILEAAAKLRIPYYKPGYYKYDFKDVRSELQQAGAKFRLLAELSKQIGIQVGYHNHTGYIGAPVWDMKEVIDPLDPKWVGYYFDVRHAVAEGGVAAWKIALNLVAPRIKMIAVKDFYWDKHPTKGWQVRNCPLGEGMVDWSYYARGLAQAKFQGPVSLHVEYDTGGATQTEKEERMLLAAERDLAFLKARLSEAYQKGRNAAGTSQTKK